MVEETNENTLKCPFVGREDVVLTPHTAFYSDFALYECQRIGARKLMSTCQKGEAGQGI